MVANTDVTRRVDARDPSTALALAEDVLERALRVGATEAEVLVMAGDSALTRFANSEIHQNVAERSLTVSLRHVVWRRIAVVSTQHFIRHWQFDDTLAVSELLLRDTEDLIHKATGWTLREVGKKDQAVLEGFLDRHGAVMPRTMLRYAIEKFPPDRRRAYLQKKTNPGGGTASGV